MSKLKNLNIKLKWKVVGGYLLIISLMVIMGVTSLVQFGSLVKRVTYSIKEVAGEVEIADKVVAEILFARTSVEKFIALNNEKDKKLAEEHIEKLRDLMVIARENIISEQSLASLDKIEKMVNEYLDTFKKMALRVNVISNNQKNLFALGEKAGDALRDVPVALKNLMAGQVFAARFLVNHSPYLEKEAQTRIERALDMLAGYGEREELVEEYLDAFIGLAAISKKMDEDVSKTLVPMA
ncbi:MAG: hypothetical protein SV775_18910, partial [Thermodesulfobacteriota bacterium]|nr:hypothetical protein [Thermodesulfobacteriota bacterium]